MFYTLTLLVLVLVVLGGIVPGPAGLVLALLAIAVALANLFNEIRRTRQRRAEARRTPSGS